MFSSIGKFIDDMFSSAGDFVVYSNNEYILRQGKGFYSAEKNEWVALEDATIFDDMAHASLPVSFGNDARFILKSEVANYVPHTESLRSPVDASQKNL